MHAHPLSLASPGQKLRIVAIADKPTRMRLTSLGFVPDATLTVLWNRGGTVVVGRAGDRMAIGRRIAEEILVEPVALP